MPHLGGRIIRIMHQETLGPCPRFLIARAIEVVSLNNMIFTVENITAVTHHVPSSPGGGKSHVMLEKDPADDNDFLSKMKGELPRSLTHPDARSRFSVT